MVSVWYGVKNSCVGGDSQRGMERKKHIDLLKFLGITGIIIAHISAPRWLMFLRSFDVPLMVFISAYLANGSYEKQRKKGKGAAAYYLSRFKRLVLPVWGFLIFYFFLQFVKDGFHLMGFRYYLDSFLLTRYGIAYVWIMLIYLYSALLVPVFDKAGISIKTSLIMLIIYAVYELCYRLRLGTDIRIIETTFYYIIPYGMVTYLGYGYDKMTKRTKLSAAVLALVSFAALALYYGMTDGAFRMVSKAKYPPRLYYLSYGMAVTFFLFLLTLSSRIDSDAAFS